MNATEFGESIAALALGVSPRMLPRIKAAQEALAASEKAADYGRATCLAAAKVFKEAGKMDTLGYHLYTKAASARRWSSTLQRLADVFTGAVGRLKSAELREALETFEEAPKQAAGGGLVKGLLAKGMTLSPDVVKAVLGLSAGVGALGGGLSWKFNRGVQEDDADAEALKARISVYRRLADEVEEDLQSNVATPAA